MEKTSSIDMRQFIGRIREHPTAHAYRDVWGKESDFGLLPTISREELFSGDLEDRRYKSSRSLMKVLRVGEGRALSEWAYEDIHVEDFGSIGARPMVLLSDPHDAMEKAMWCYERGVVPLLGETHNTSVALSMAEAYVVDSIIADTASVEKLRQFLESGRRSSAVTLLGETFDGGALSWIMPLAQEVRLLLALPEVGAFAEAALSERLEFSPLDGCVVDASGGTLVVTKERSLVTPIIKYDTGISSQGIEFTK